MLSTADEKIKAFNSLAKMYESIVTVQLLDEIVRLEDELGLTSNFIVVSEELGNGDMCYSLKLQYFKNIISKTAIVISTSLAPIDERLKYYILVEPDNHNISRILQTKYINISKFGNMELDINDTKDWIVYDKSKDYIVPEELFDIKKD